MGQLGNPLEPSTPLFRCAGSTTLLVFSTGFPPVQNAPSPISSEKHPCQHPSYPYPPSGASGHTGALGLPRPSNMASLQLWPLPLRASCQALGYKRQRPHSPRLLMLPGAHLGAERPGPSPRTPQGGLNVHPVLWPLGKAPELFSAPGSFRGPPV